MATHEHYKLVGWANELLGSVDNVNEAIQDHLIDFEGVQYKEGWLKDNVVANMDLQVLRDWFHHWLLEDAKTRELITARPQFITYILGKDVPMKPRPTTTKPTAGGKDSVCKALIAPTELQRADAHEQHAGTPAKKAARPSRPDAPSITPSATGTTFLFEVWKYIDL